MFLQLSHGSLQQLYAIQISSAEHSSYPSIVFSLLQLSHGFGGQHPLRRHVLFDEHAVYSAEHNSHGGVFLQQLPLTQIASLLQFGLVLHPEQGFNAGALQHPLA
jgi:hypothetical protein